MKSALCLFGKVGGTEGKDGLGELIDFERCYQHYKEHIIDINQCDVFIHCWDIDLSEKLINLYKPKSFLFEPQIDFFETKKEENIDIGKFRAYSRWYSTKKVLELKRSFEKKNKFRYDFIMLGRFDLMWLVDFDFSKLNKKNFYAAVWNAPPLLSKKDKKTKKLRGPDRINRSLSKHQLADLWFVMSSKMSDKFGKLYDRLGVDFQASGHRASWKQAKSVVKNPEDIIYKFYRWYDFELYRWHVCGCYR